MALRKRAVLTIIIIFRIWRGGTSAGAVWNPRLLRWQLEGRGGASITFPSGGTWTMGKAAKHDKPEKVRLQLLFSSI